MKNLAKLVPATLLFLLFSSPSSAAIVNLLCSIDGGTNCPSAGIEFGNPTVVSELEVTQGTCPGVVTDVDVYIDVDHTWTGDLVIKLHHEIQSVTIFNKLCHGDDDILATFDDEALDKIDCNLPTPVGQGGAVTPSSPLSAMDGTNAEGTWSLEVIDTAAGDSGQLLDWGLIVTCEPPPPPSLIEISGGYISLDVTNGAPPINADCEEPAHEGRMVYDNVNSVLYICSSTGWQSK
jgi:subtilisin-like proprotein convertase family protein